MRYVALILLWLALNAWIGLSFLSSFAIVIWLWYLLELFENSNDTIAFKEFILTLYGLNYLFAPALTYLNGTNGFYRMKLPEDQYFLLAIPSILLLHAGLNTIKTSIFRFDFKTVQLGSHLNRNMLVTWLYVGTGLRFFNQFLPADLAFFFYLLSSIRFVAAYGLFLMDARQYKWHLLFILGLELVMALKQGMFHDFVMWMIFFGLFWVYIKKPGRNLKILMGFAVLLILYIIQIAKSDYRSQLGSGDDSGIEQFQDVVEKKMNEEQGLFSTSNTTGSLARANQAWIFSSTANRMNQVQDYQGVDLLGKYAEAAFLPRFLAPDKLRAGDKEIFNRFSGHRVSSGTSMGLGFFADGYIAYGPLGTYAFAYLLGLIFALVFKLVENWSKVSPFFILLMFPILHYAVRPDCETQTILGHIVKGVFVFGCLMWYHKNQFSRTINEINQEKNMTAIWKARMAKSQAKLN